jgi:hypothetical protein
MSTGSGVSPPVRVNVPPFEDPEELDLQLHRHLRHLVEEEGAVRRSLEHTVVPSIGAGEAAPLVTEELALNEHGRERAAIQCDIRPVPASAQVVKVRATSSLPVPLSPTMRTVAFVGATREICA